MQYILIREMYQQLYKYSDILQLFESHYSNRSNMKGYFASRTIKISVLPIITNGKMRIVLSFITVTLCTEISS